jgi:OOP family OmpA-OmpF porin
MNHVMKSAVAGAAALTLASCAGLQLQKAEVMEPMGSTFDNALAKDYLGLSRDEFQEGDYRDSDTFAVASMTAGQGSPVLPEEIGSRRLPADHVDELTGARNRLMAALNAGARDVIPDETARAQTCFDGWMQEQEENFQPDDIAARRDCFMDAMGKVEAALAGGPRGAFLVFFDWNKSNLTPEALEIVQNVVGTAKEMSVSQVDLVGHTDTSGSASYNLGLSKRRADTVKNAMVGMGVPAGIITATGVGQSDPLVPTGDNVREPQNRRVEINLQK